MASRKSRRTRQEDPEEMSSEAEVKLAMAEKEIEMLRKELKKLHHSNKDYKADETPNNHDNFMAAGAAGGAGLENTTEDQAKSYKLDGDDIDDGGLEATIHRRRKAQGDVPLPRQMLFDGKQPWDTFIKQFKAMAQHCKWTEQETRFRLLNCLRDTAAEYVYSVLPATTLDAMPLLEKALEDRFAEKRSKNTYLAELEQRKFSQKESVTEYSTDIRRLVVKGYPTADPNTREAIELRHFIRGLSDQQMTLAVGMKNPSNLKEAQEAVETYLSLRDELIKTPSARVRAIQSAPNQDENRQGPVESDVDTVTQKQLNDLIVTLDKRFNGLSKLMKQGPKKPYQNTGDASRPRQNAQRDFRCYNCDEEGHIARNCPAKNAKPSTYIPGTPKNQEN